MQRGGAVWHSIPLSGGAATLEANRPGDSLDLLSDIANERVHEFAPAHGFKPGEDAQAGSDPVT
ncbi:hypothetical protein BH24ACT26_BH24ACT26_03120 [soil metagenome]